jgi:uncharacterized protein (TIGR02117 family)
MVPALFLTARVVLWLIELVFGFITFYFLLFFGGGIFYSGAHDYAGEIEFFVKTNGVHSDLCLPVKSEVIDWSSFIAPSDFPEVNKFEYISIGWGDKGFFLDTPEWSDLTIETALNAAFFSSPTAMHVAYHEHKPIESAACAKVFISKQKYLDLIVFIKSSFAMEHEKVTLIPNRSYWKNDNFYEANGNYHLFNTCNRWTNEALKIVDVRTGLFALSSEGIMLPLKK